MKQYKTVISYFVLAILILPGISLASSRVYSEGGFYEAAPVKTEGQVTTTTSGSSMTVINPADALPNNILGIHIKTKAERDAERAAEEAALARKAEEQRVARNADGTFAYGYTNGSGAQYASGAQYVDARTTRLATTRTNSLNVAAAGTTTLAGFFPTTFWGWVLALILLAVFFAILRALIDKMNTRRPHAVAHGH